MDDAEQRNNNNKSGNIEKRVWLNASGKLSGLDEKFGAQKKNRKVFTSRPNNALNRMKKTMTTSRGEKKSIQYNLIAAKWQSYNFCGFDILIKFIAIIQAKWVSHSVDIFGLVFIR